MVHQIIGILKGASFFLFMAISVEAMIASVRVMAYLKQ